MPKHSKAVQKCADELKHVVADPVLEPDFRKLLVTAKVELTTNEYDRSFLEQKRGGYPPIESLLERVSDSHEPTLSEAFQEMIGKGYDYNTAALKMIETAVFIIQINKRLHEGRAALLASAASDREGHFG